MSLGMYIDDGVIFACGRDWDCIEAAMRDWYSECVEWLTRASAKLHALQLRGKLLFLRFFGFFVLFCPFPWYLPNFSLFLST